MLNESTANALFGNEDPIGKVVKVNSEHTMSVTAVYEDLPYNTNFKDMAFLLPWEVYAQREWIKNARDSWSNNSFQLFVLRSNFTQGKQVGGRIKYVWLFGVIGAFVLLLACINFMNLCSGHTDRSNLIERV